MKSQSRTPEEKKDLFIKGKEFLEMYNKVANFTQELLQENTQLQQRLTELYKERERLLAPLISEEEKKLQEKIEKLKQEKEGLLKRFKEVTEENRDFIERYKEIEMENNNLANLYVASYQLHSTLDFQEVLNIITEIIINLIGAQRFGIMLHDEKKGLLKPVKLEGLSSDFLPVVKLGEGIIGSVAKSGEIYYREIMDDEPKIDPNEPMVCVPMKIQEKLVGVIVVYGLLPQKQKLVRVDYELFSLLAQHSATAIFGATLYADSIRKRATIKGFLDLVTH